MPEGSLIGAQAEREQDFRSLVEKFPDVVARFDRQYRYLYVSPHIQIYTGIAPPQLVGKTHREAGFPPGLCDLWETKLAECFAGGRSLSFEFQFTAPAGDQQWHEARLVPEINPHSQQVESVMCVGREITELKRTRQALQQVHDEMISTLEQVAEGFAALDRHWRYTYVNAAAEKLLGKTKEQLLGRTPWEALPQHEASALLARFTQVIEENAPRDFEAFCPAQRTWIECRCYPSADGVVLFLADVTQRKQAAQALRDSEEHFRPLVEGVKDYALFLLDAQGNVASWNSGAQRLKGYSAEEIMGCHFSRCYPLEEVAAGRPQQDLETAIREGSCRREGWLICKGGSRVWAETLLTALRDEDGSLRGFAEVAHDITERKHIEEALNHAKEQAEAANHAKDQFLAVLSHELRTPLTPVLAAICLMEGDRARIPRRSAGSGGMALIRRNIELEARLIDDLLDLTRITRGKVELRHEVMDINVALRHALQICRVDIRAKQLDVRLELTASRHTIWADPARIQQVFWNLLKNAIKFTPERGRIVLRTADLGEDRIRVEVQDTGMGIEPDLLPRLFDAFEQGDKNTTRRFGGLGLGLTISKAIVDMHGGTLSAFSDGKGKGATFSVELVATVGAPPVVPSAAVRPHPQDKLTTVLLVEDHDDTRRIMARLLRGLGYVVKTAAGVHDALAILDQEPVDVLLSDLGLPDGSGYDIMEHVKGRGGVRGIAFSGYGMEEDIVRSQQSGFSRHLTKPVKPQDLDAAICQLIT